MRARKAVALQTSAEHRPIAAGTRLAPGGKAMRSQITMCFLARQCLERVGKKFVNCRGANPQTLKKRIHALSPQKAGVDSLDRPHGQKRGATASLATLPIRRLCCDRYRHLALSCAL